MSVDDPTVRRIANLARIQLTDAEVAPLAGELNTILGWIEQLAAVDTSSVEPMTAVIPITRAWRDDVVTDGGITDAVLGNAPQPRGNFFGVPKVIE